MPRAREWADEFHEGIKAYGFSEEQIHRYKDADWDTMEEPVQGARDKIIQNAEQGRRTLLLCFYAGHGCTFKGETRVLLNSNQRDDGEDLSNNKYSL